MSPGDSKFIDNDSLTKGYAIAKHFFIASVDAASRCQNVAVDEEQECIIVKRPNRRLPVVIATYGCTKVSQRVVSDVTSHSTIRSLS